MTMTRPATIDDLPRVLDMCLDMHQESRYSNYALDWKKIREQFVAIMNAPHGIFLITDNGFLLGAVAEYWFGPAKYAFELLLYVKPEARGSSEAPTLVKAYAAAAKALGAVDIHVENSTGYESEKVERLFAKLGFTRVGGNFIMEV